MLIIIGTSDNELTVAALNLGFFSLAVTVYLFGNKIFVKLMDTDQTVNLNYSK